MSDLGRFAFEPLMSLVDGIAVGVEVRRRADRDRTEFVAPRVVWGPRQLAEFDTGIAIASVLHDTAYDATVPLHVDLTADSVVAARPRILTLRSMLQERMDGHPLPPIVLDVRQAQSAAPPAALADGLAELRAGGFAIALDGAGRGFGLDLIADVAPDLVKIEADVVERLPTDPRARVVVTALCTLAENAEIRVVADGVTHREELAALRDHGVTLAQGPLLAGLRARPGCAGVVLPTDLMPRIQAARAHRGLPGRRAVPPLAALARPAVTLPDHVAADAVREAFVAHPQAASVVLLDEARHPTGFLDRNRFMIAVSGPFGHALHARRPAAGLAEPPRTLGGNTDVHAALEYCLSDRARSWDDLVLLDGSLRCAGIVPVSELLQAATGVRSSSVA